MHLNRDYVYDGKEHDPKKLFVVESAEPERKKLRQALLDYCGQDTLAMVKIVDVISGRA